MGTPITEETAVAFFAANPRLAEDPHNQEIILFWVDYLRSKHRESDFTIENLAKYVETNKNEFHWLRDEAEIRKAAADAAAAATPPPESPKPEPRLKGQTIAERLAQVGVQASQHVSHTDKIENDQKQRNVLTEIANSAAKTKRELERRQAIETARNTVIYRGDGRVDHAATADAKRNALKALGISE